MLAATLVACTSAVPASTKQDPSTVPEIRARHQEIGRLIQEEVGDPVASEPSECGVVAIGAKPCGGPARYVVYSRRVSNVPKLESLAAESTKLDQALNKLLGRIGDCSLVLPPEPAIVAGRCQANHGGATKAVQ